MGSNTDCDQIAEWLSEVWLADDWKYRVSNLFASSEMLFCEFMLYPDEPWSIGVHVRICSSGTVSRLATQLPNAEPALCTFLYCFNIHYIRVEQLSTYTTTQ